MEEKKKKSIGHILTIKKTDIGINRFVFVEIVSYRWFELFILLEKVNWYRDFFSIYF